MILFVDNRARQILKQYKIDADVDVSVIKAFAVKVVNQVAESYRTLLNETGQDVLPTKDVILGQINRITEQIAVEYRSRDENFFSPD